MSNKHNGNLRNTQRIDYSRLHRFGEVVELESSDTENENYSSVEETVTQEYDSTISEISNIFMQISISETINNTQINETEIRDIEIQNSVTSNLSNTRVSDNVTEISNIPLEIGTLISNTSTCKSLPLEEVDYTLAASETVELWLTR